MFGSVQFSRGCPFQCEFCDIILTFGRRPRLKTTRRCWRSWKRCQGRLKIVFIVDDNLIGNKIAMKELLREVAAWQAAEGYPLTFFTEASIDLAEDDELIECMVEANIQTVFIGIESPNEESLRETKKYQNVTKGGRSSSGSAMSKTRASSLCGMIVGFDHDDIRTSSPRIASSWADQIMHAMVGMLSAIPKTPLYARLADEGRLDNEEEECSART